MIFPLCRKPAFLQMVKKLVCVCVCVCVCLCVCVHSAQISSHLEGAANVLLISFLSDCLGTRKVACRDLLCIA